MATTVTSPQGLVPAQRRRTSRPATATAAAPRSLPIQNQSSPPTTSSNPQFQQAIDDVRLAGYSPQDPNFWVMVDQYNRDLGGAATSGANGVVGASSGGSGSSPYASAIRTLYGMYNRPADSSLMNLLQQYTGEAQQTGANAISQLRAALSAQQNPYSGQVAQGVVASNPLEQYMRAGGVSSGGVDALQQLLAATTAQGDQAAQGYQDRLAQSWQAQQQSRMSDAEATAAAFQQMLAANAANAKQQLAQQQQSRRDELMMQILQMAVSGGVDLSKLGVTF